MNPIQWKKMLFVKHYIYSDYSDFYQHTDI